VAPRQPGPRVGIVSDAVEPTSPCAGKRHMSRTERDSKTSDQKKIEGSFGLALCLPYTGSWGIPTSGEAERQSHGLLLLISFLFLCHSTHSRKHGFHQIGNPYSRFIMHKEESMK
jgi:hypothetical protein